MSHRTIQMPLSGGDRKHYARELTRVEYEHGKLVKKIASAHGAADEYRRPAFRYECEEWNARLFICGDIDPSLRIRDALAAGINLLEVKCGQYRAVRVINLTDVVRPRQNPVHTLRPKLFCEPCYAITGRRFRPLLVRLDMSQPGPDAPATAIR